MKRSYDEILSAFHLLVRVARIDGDIAHEELDFIYRIAKRNNITLMDRDNILKGYYSFKPPKEEGKRIVIFHQLLLLVYCDKLIQESELNSCHNLGLKLGLNPGVVTELLAIMKKDPEVAIDPQRIVKKFKTFRN